MENTVQWSIQWDIPLLPPQEMLPTNSSMPRNDTAYTNSEHLFGFSPCVPTLLGEDFSAYLTGEELETCV